MAWQENDNDERPASSTSNANILSGSSAFGEGRRFSSSDNNEGISDSRDGRSPYTGRLSTVRQIGGPNSVDRFAQSWQRAAEFFEITPARPSFRYASEEDENVEEFKRVDVEGSTRNQRSLLRQALESDGRRASENVISDDSERNETTPLIGYNAKPPAQPGRTSSPSQSMSHRQSYRSHSVFSLEPSLSSPFSGNYGTSFSSYITRLDECSAMQPGGTFQEHILSGSEDTNKVGEPLLVKQVEEDGKIINIIVGQSTLPQTIFNSVNVLIGIGLLSLPLAFKYSGWIIGLPFFIFSAVITSYTAKLLAKCLDKDVSLISFADIAYVSFGSKARIAISLLFTLELLATCVALVVLFADTLHSLISGLSIIGWKVVCGVIVIPLSFAPLRLLSFTSILGILCCFGIVLAVLVDGLLKAHQPGSLREPAKTYLFPNHWMTVPLSFGLLMSPWGGHAIFPNIYRDMRHPHKYSEGVNITYVFTFGIDMSMGAVGLLMFGDNVRDEITANIFATPGYPRWISLFIVICVAIVPLTKLPLAARPINSTLETLFGLDPRISNISSRCNRPSDSNSLSRPNRTSFDKTNTRTTISTLRFLLRTTVIAVFVLLAILFPDFDRIMSLIGSVACFGICIILPLAFHLKLYGHEMGRMQKGTEGALIAVSSIMAVAGTVAACLPRDVLMEEDG